MIKTFFTDNLKFGFLLSILSVFLVVMSAGFLALPIGIIGFLKSKKAVREGKVLGVIGALLSAAVMLYVLLLLFVIGYTMFIR